MAWCGVTGTLLIADFNNDGKDDLLCHEQSTGKKWISYNRYPSKGRQPFRQTQAFVEIWPPEWFAIRTVAELVFHFVCFCLLLLANVGVRSFCRTLQSRVLPIRAETVGSASLHVARQPDIDASAQVVLGGKCVKSVSYTFNVSACFLPNIGSRGAPRFTYRKPS